MGRASVVRTRFRGDCSISSRTRSLPIAPRGAVRCLDRVSWWRRRLWRSVRLRLVEVVHSRQVPSVSRRARPGSALAGWDPGRPPPPKRGQGGRAWSGWSGAGDRSRAPTVGHRHLGDAAAQVADVDREVSHHGGLVLVHPSAPFVAPSMGRRSASPSASISLTTRRSSSLIGSGSRRRSSPAARQGVPRCSARHPAGGAEVARHDHLAARVQARPPGARSGCSSIRW